MIENSPLQKQTEFDIVPVQAEKRHNKNMQTFSDIDSTINETELVLKDLRKQLADTDQWWKSNPKITAHTFTDNDDWLRLRNSLDDRLGGSELGTVAGHNRYTSPYATFCSNSCPCITASLSDKSFAATSPIFSQNKAYGDV